MKAMKERKAMKGLAAIGLALGMASISLGCPEQGAMEKAGDKMDEVVDDITHPGEGPLEEAGRKVDETVDEAKD